MLKRAVSDDARLAIEAGRRHHRTAGPLKGRVTGGEQCGASPPPPRTTAIARAEASRASRPWPRPSATATSSRPACARRRRRHRSRARPRWGARRWPPRCAARARELARGDPGPLPHPDIEVHLVATAGTPRTARRPASRAAPRSAPQGRGGIGDAPAPRRGHHLHPGDPSRRWRRPPSIPGARGRSWLCPSSLAARDQRLGAPRDQPRRAAPAPHGLARPARSRPGPRCGSARRRREPAPRSGPTSSPSTVVPRRPGLDVELVDQPPAPRQPQAQRTRRAVPAGQHPRKVGDARAPVARTRCAGRAARRRRPPRCTACPPPAWIQTLRASSEAAVVIAAVAKVSNPRAWASSRAPGAGPGRRRPRSRCFIVRVRDDLGAIGQLGLGIRRCAEQRQPLVDVQRGADAVHRVAHAHQRRRHLRAHARRARCSVPISCAILPGLGEDARHVAVDHVEPADVDDEARSRRSLLDGRRARPPGRPRRRRRAARSGCVTSSVEADAQDGDAAARRSGPLVGDGLADHRRAPARCRRRGG